MAWKARLFWLFLGSIGLAVAVTLYAILDDGMPFSEQILFTAFLFAIHALLALLGAVMWQRERVRPMVAIGMTLVLSGGAGWITLIWLEQLGYFRGSGHDWMPKLCATGSFGGVAVLIRGLVLWPDPRTRAVDLVSTVAWLTGASAAVCFLVGIWFEAWLLGERILVKLVASAMTISAGCSVAVFIIARLAKGDLVERDDTVLGSRTPVSIVCPRCRQPISITANRSDRCPDCGLEIRIEFAEPRCDCGYLLVGLEGETCPECGHAIAESKHRRGDDVSTRKHESA